MKYKETVKLRLDDKNACGALKISAVLRIFEQIAECQSLEMNIDGGALKKDGNAWIINRIIVETYKTFPEITTVDATTYPREGNGIEFSRDFAITKTGGALIARGSSSWSLMNIEKRRLIPCRDLTNYKEYCESSEMLDKPYRKVRADNSCNSADDLRLRVKTMRSDEDSLGHLHNVRYVEFCINALTDDEYRRGIDSINITFIREALIGCVIDIYAKYTEDGAIFMQGKVAKEAEEYFCFACVIILK